MPVRLSVAIGVVFFSALALVSLAEHGRTRGTALAGVVARAPWRVALTSMALVSIGVALEARSHERWASIALDWLPGAYLLAGYWLPAQLARRTAPALQARLEAADRRLFEGGLARLVDAAPRVLLEYLEAAYLCCYVIVPAGLAWMYVAGRRAEADAFWTAVLLAALPCYALVARCETRPPRSIDSQRFVRPRHLAVRSLNLAVLGRASIGVNTFPSGHAAASLAAALSVGAVMPAAGAALAVVAVSIAVASVVGRYHFALDALFGALAGLVAFALSAALRL